MGATTWAAASGFCLGTSTLFPQNASARHFKLLRQEVSQLLGERPDFVARLDGPRRLWGDAAKFIVDVDFRLPEASLRFYFSDGLDAKWLVSPGAWAETLLTSFNISQNGSFADLLEAFWEKLTIRMALRKRSSYRHQALHQVPKVKDSCCRCLQVFC